MEIKNPCYLHAILNSPRTRDDDRLSVQVADLRQLVEECELKGRLSGRPYMMSAEDACFQLQITKPTLYKWLRTGILHGRKIGKKWQVYEDDVISVYEYNH